jgi:hypothetical protein
MAALGGSDALDKHPHFHGLLIVIAQLMEAEKPGKFSVASRRQQSSDLEKQLVIDASSWLALRGANKSLFKALHMNWRSVGIKLTEFASFRSLLAFSNCLECNPFYIV